MPDLIPSRQKAAIQPGSVLLQATRAARADDPPAQSMLFTEPLKILCANSLDDLPALFAQLTAAQRDGLWAAGYFSYECAYHWEPSATPANWRPDTAPLALFGIYRQPAQPVDLPSEPARQIIPEPLPLRISAARFTEQVHSVQQFIEAGDTYQANLTTRIETPFTGDPDALFAQMLAAQPVEFGAHLYLESDTHILSASPELFFHLRGRNIEVRPMKGTASRGRNAAEDAERAVWLAADPKNRAENLMIVDLLRNDLGRVAETGSVTVTKLFDIELFPTLLQMTSRVQARLRPEIGPYELFRAIFPSGSIVGAPKIRTMQILRALESDDRGVYTGAIGYFAPNGDATFSVAIRTAVLRNGKLSMGVGAGITYDSDPAAEYRECELKAAFLQQEPFSLIETLRWENSRCALLPLHLRRLMASAGYFGFPCNQAQIESEVQAHAAHLNPALAWKLRLLLHANGTVTFSPAEPLADAPNEPERIALASETVHSSDRFLAHKTTRRALYNTTLSRARRQGFADAVFLNEHGHVTECSISNIFVRHNSHWRTPPTSAGALPGVFRAHLLATMPNLAMADLTLRDLETADEICTANAVRGMRTVEFVPVPLVP